MASIVTRVGLVHFLPAVDVDNTRSLDEHLGRNRQSCQGTESGRAASIAADGIGSARISPATGWSLIAAAWMVVPHDAPPSVDRQDSSWVVAGLSATTITVPFGCTSGWPAKPVVRLPVSKAGPQVRPPSVEVDILSRFLSAWSSNSV